MSSIEPFPAGSNERQQLKWVVRSRSIVLDRPIVFGILNVTPDSFSDGGLFESTDAALAQVERMVAEGADAIDIGGESTRPQGARPVDASEEMARVIPIVRAVCARYPDLCVSVDTTKADVALGALNAGADVINDVSGFRIDPAIADIVAATASGVVLMHSRGSVEEMGTYRYANYGSDAVADVERELRQSLDTAQRAGVKRASIVLDPGIGFAKRTEHSLRILAELDRLVALGYPLMVGVSRKRFVGELSGVTNASDRVAGTVGANVAALMRGARLFRVHDVAPNRQALDVAWGVLNAAHASSGEANAKEHRASSSRFPVPGSHHP